MEFYSTLRYELILEAYYQSCLAAKEAELAQGSSKFTANALVSLPNRVFHIVNGCMYQETVDPSCACPACPEDGGRIYRLDPSFSEQVYVFLHKHANCKITFQPSGRYGPTIGYSTGDTNVFPAILEALDGSGETLVVEDETKYEPLVL